MGVEWFRSVPARPGVYRMYDASGRLLYVGKAGNLRARLASYRRTRGQPRKIVRLVHEADRIEVETCVDEPAARLRENELIRSLRPPFNRAGTWPRSAVYVRVVVPEQGGLAMECTREPCPGDFGAFRASAALACAAMVRLAWRVLNPAASVVDMPRGMLSGVGPWSLRDARAVGWIDDATRFLSGESPCWLARCLRELAAPCNRFEDAWVSADLGRIAEFYVRGPERLRWLRSRLGLRREQVLPEELDDLPVMSDRMAMRAGEAGQASAGEVTGAAGNGGPATAGRGASSQG
jgi:hypothetical protein